ncbi:hypothetical protein A2Z00_00900 [Candidatus Gottesmanbacteria bacterium RBG_13_45_10]|uniref:FCP1 homology domain-containing protein n=1 Tax=Candidatus Gottesmanbacteria bacterium RBG_13_45_10 TaxID=1798370 RepID=A0A1F5ZIG7_9BACT|nr:MAG: hypothetical protein A2Z00_00900 [Candidatus Gottesmanbacteria bacterium RBG_13_45_10]
MADEITALQTYLDKHTKTHLIFDFDETLVRLVLPWEDWIKDFPHLPDKQGKKIMEKYNKGLLSVSGLQNELVRQYGQSMRQKIFKNDLVFETKMLRTTEVNEALIQCVKNLKGYEIYLWTSNTRKAVKKVLKNVSLASVFTKIVARDDVSYLKPDPEGFYILRDAHIAKEKYLFIGNSHNDRFAAKAAGIDYFQIDYFNKRKVSPH